MSALAGLSDQRLAGSIPFNVSSFSDEEIQAVLVVLNGGRHAGNGPATWACNKALERLVDCERALITQSGTAALEMAALLLDLRPGDEVIMPSWTFTSTANAIALRGATPVFVDIDPQTLNIDVSAARLAVTPGTKAVICVHYAGAACDMEGLLLLCRDHGLALIEDAAQAVGASWRGHPLGGIGDLGALSFHATKNISCGEGGALLVNAPDQVARAEMIWEKGTDRLRFLRGETPAYEWRTLGSSFLPSEITAGLLSAALGTVSIKTRRRVAAWNFYDAKLRQADLGDRLRLPSIDTESSHNGHIYHIRFDDRSTLQAALADDNIIAQQHYEPLHLTEAGQRLGRAGGALVHTEATSRTLLRLPLFDSISSDQQMRVIDSVVAAVTKQEG